ncbi:MAG TPA: hypothetical protein PLZ51_09630, partial [Aggregatilineales bacterium]|nr:hypothetical protein [Aggregatilineales bacterium]
VDIIGVAEGLTPRLIPDKVTALVTGAQTILDTMAATDIRIIVDMNGKGAGTYDTVPQIASGRSDILAQDISILPSNLTVILISDAEVTPTAIPEITAENTPMPPPEITPENTITPSP